MIHKTITIDMEAYELLAHRKRSGQSFSTVIKEHLGKRKTAAALLEALPSLALEETTLDQIEKQVKERRRSPARTPRL